MSWMNKNSSLLFFICSVHFLLFTIAIPPWYCYVNLMFVVSEELKKKFGVLDVKIISNCHKMSSPSVCLFRTATEMSLFSKFILPRCEVFCLMDFLFLFFWQMLQLMSPPAGKLPFIAVLGENDKKGGCGRINPASSTTSVLCLYVWDNIIASLHPNRHHSGSEIDAVLQHIGLYNLLGCQIAFCAYLEKV